MSFHVGSEREKGHGSSSSVEPPVSSSETDFSDFEGSGEKETSLMAKVRQCSLQAINAVIDVSWSYEEEVLRLHVEKCVCVHLCVMCM